MNRMDLGKTEAVLSIFIRCIPLSTTGNFQDNQHSLHKAFDTVNRNLLWFKLMSNGISGRILDAIQSLYENVQCTVKVNDTFSPWFPVTHGIKQGCTCKISQTLFSVYITDLAQDIRRLNIFVV